MAQGLDLVSGVTTLCKYAFDRGTIEKGLGYHTQGRVLSSNALVHKTNLHVHATVRGSRPTPYLVEAQLYRKNAGVRIEAICTCPVGINCKHAVAAIADIFGKDGLKLFDIHHSRITLEEAETAVEAAPEELDGEMAAWLASLAEAREPAARPPAKTIVYLVDLEGPRGGLRVRIMHCGRLKSGAWGKASPYRVQDLGPNSLLAAEDLSILRELAGTEYLSDAYALQGRFGSQMLERLVATGKCYWKTVHQERLLKAGAARRAEPEWAVEADGWQKPALHLEPAANVALLMAPPLYVDEQTGECGRMESRCGPEQLNAWIAAPLLPPEQSGAVAARIAGLGFPAPREIAVVARRHVRPTPVMRLRHVALARPAYSTYGRWQGGGYTPPEALDVAHFELDYDGQRVDYFEDGSSVDVYREGRVERMERDERRESAYLDEFDASGLQGVEEVYGVRVPEELEEDLAMPTAEAWMAFMSEEVPKFQKRGWRVEIDRDFRYQYATVEDWYAETTRDDTANDWFAVELGILVEGKRVNLLPLIRGVLEELGRLKAGEKMPEQVDVRLADGRYVRLPAQRVLDIGKTLAELYDPSALAGGRLGVSRLRAVELVSIAGTGQWKGDEELRQLAARLAGYRGIVRLAAPAGLRATLRPYQLDGLSWLQFLREFGFGGILADDMGLGKTVQVLAHVQMEKEAGRANLPSLVVAPTSLMATWRGEAERSAPGLRVLVSHGGERKAYFEELAKYDVIVTTYALLPRDEEILKKQPFHLLILDEAQYVKNPNTKWADVARGLSARHRLCMTGTPMENHLGELWSLMTFLSPGYLGTQQQFGRVYRQPIEKQGDAERRHALAQRLRPFILRRRKEEVAQELPPKTEITRTVELEGAQRDLYETIRLAMHERVREEVARKGMDRSHIIILDALLKLRQACCDPRLVKLEQARRVRESAKLETLMEMVPEMLDEGRRILLFSQFTGMLDLIEGELRGRKTPFVRLDGSTTDRETPVQRFQAGEVPLFLISLKAGGTGLNLTAADTVIHYDPWWNPAVEQQATDRAHRIGQDKPVFVYKLVTKGTVEEKIVAMQDRKRELVAGLLGEGAQGNLQLSKEDLEHLFEAV